MTPGFFILGHPRSGTSLLRNVLNAHPWLCVPPECGFLLWLRPRFEQAEWNAATRQRFIAEVVSSRKFETWELSEAQLSAAIGPAPIASYPEAASLVYSAYAAAKGKHIKAWGDKNNYYVQHVQELVELMPTARIVHIVRDPRDVFCSYLELGRTNITSKYGPALSANASEVADEWQRNHARIIHQREHAPERYLLVKYEDLVGSFDEQASALFTFLGVPTPQGFDRRSHIERLDEPAEFLQWKRKVTGPVDTSSVGRFRTELDRATVLSIEEAAWEGMQDLGYIPQERS